MKTLTSSLVLPLLALLLLATGCVAQPTPPALKVGDPAPDFKLKGSDGKDYDLAQFKGKQAIVLCWFPRAGSGGATIQCGALQAVMAQVPTDKVQVFGCSTAALDVTTSFAQAGQYRFPVLSDADHAAAQAYGCLRADGLSERWTFLIDAQGVIQSINKAITPPTQGTELTKMLAAAGLAGGNTGAGVAPPAAGTDQQITLPLGAQTRNCAVHLPPGYDATKSLPLVIVLHGSPGSGKNMGANTGLNALADQHGFIVAGPDGIAGVRSWNSLFGTIPGGTGLLSEEVDDVAFLRALIAHLHQTYNTDPARVFVCGHSAGAYMSYRAAVELSDVVAAVGVVNGSLGIKSLDSKPCEVTIPAPVAPVSLIHVCGKKDGTVKFEGAQAPKNLFKPVLECVQFFVDSDGCKTPGVESTDAAHGVVRTLYSGGQAGTEVKLVIVENCAHQWPTAKEGLDASAELWEFFATHPKVPAGG